MKKLVKLVKKNQGGGSELAPRVVRATGQNSWSKVIQSWVVEFRQRDETELLPPFAQLFDAEPSNTENPSEGTAGNCPPEETETE